MNPPKKDLIKAGNTNKNKLWVNRKTTIKKIWERNKAESIHENKTNKIFLIFQIQTDHPIFFRRSNQVLNYTKKFSEFCRSSGP